MIRRYDRKRRQPTRPTLGVVINQRADGFAQNKIDDLIGEIARARYNWHIINSDVKKEVVYQIKKLLSRRPAGIIACGGDGTVNLVARNLIRRTCSLGIYPLGKFNNIYKALYGQPDLKFAVEQILSSKSRKIDYGLASGRFFLGSLGLGLIPNLHKTLEQKRVPRFGIGWSRLTSQAASSVEAKRTSITIDEFKFDVTPLIININLLPYTIGLALTPGSIEDDGKLEVVFDMGAGQSIPSGYIRKIFKRKYIYSDEIRMYCGRKIIISPVSGRELYIDGEIINISDSSLDVETFPGKIRIFGTDGK